MRDNDLPDLLHPAPFLYAIRTPDGDAWLDIYCADRDRAALERGRVAALNRDDAECSGRYETVALYTADQVAAMLAGHGLSRTWDEAAALTHGTFTAVPEMDASGSAEPAR